MIKLNRALILHHNDADGVIGAKICEQGIKRKYPEIQNIEFKEQYYGGSHLNSDDIDNQTLYVIVDFSYPVVEMDFLLSRINFSHVIWIDHHVTALSTYLYYEKNSFIQGLRVPHGLCAAELAYAYFFLNATQSRYNSNEFFISGHRFHTTDRMSMDIFFDKIPLGLKYIGDWDVWRWKEDEEYNGRKIHEAFQVNAPKSFNKNEQFWKIFYNQNMNESDELKQLLMEGEIAIKYENAKASRIRKYYAFPVKVTGQNIEAICLNTTIRNSLVFKDCEDEYEVGIVYSYNGKNYPFSIYRLNKNPQKDINVGEIAYSFGGGGHKKAAGFVLDNPFIAIQPIL